ncbi:putative hydrolase protein [Acetobacteraceae bacterium EV16G]|uniref:Hydrolase protein n=1 Tax=Sorlinia euscelidii TaxID=3081148 RepID=A0ABU7TZJ9_9PROT
MTENFIPAALKLIIFDCDGVLIDSEDASSRLIAEVASSCGVEMTPGQALVRFSGTQFSVVKKALEADLKKSLPDDLVTQMQARMVAMMKDEARPVKGVEALLNDVKALGYAFRVASNSSREEMDAKFARAGLTPFFPDDRIHSAFDVPRAKPAPDVYLAAAAAEKRSAQECLVVEDSLPGAKAAEKAGMACVFLHEDGQRPADAPPNLTVIRSLSELGRALRNARGRT